MRWHAILGRLLKSIDYSRKVIEGGADCAAVISMASSGIAAVADLAHAYAPTDRFVGLNDQTYS